MKQFTVLLLLGVLFSSCYSTKQLKSKEELDANVNSAIKYLNELGYSQTGLEYREDNNLVVTGVSYSSHSGYGTAMRNDRIYSELYSFSNSAGNTVEFTVSYKAYWEDGDTVCYTYDTIMEKYYYIGEPHIVYKEKVVKKEHKGDRFKTIVVSDVSIPQCKTNKSEEYDKICNNSSPVMQIGNLKKDITFKKLKVFSSLLVGGVVTASVLLPFILMESNP